MVKLSENAQKVLVFLQENPMLDMTAKEVAEASGVPTKSITGIVNGLVKKGLVARESIKLSPDKDMKIIRVTDEGMNVDFVEE